MKVCYLFSLASAATHGVYGLDEKIYEKDVLNSEDYLELVNESPSLLRGTETINSADVLESAGFSCISPLNKLKDMGILKACRQQSRRFRDAYTCTHGQQLCCTPNRRAVETDFGKPRKYGMCTKVQEETGAETPVDEIALVDIPDKSGESLVKLPESKLTDSAEEFELAKIDCIGPSNKLKRNSLREACRQQRSAYKVPYTCTHGQKLCCTRSSIKETSFGNPKRYGTCRKLPRGNDEEDQMTYYDANTESVDEVHWEALSEA